MKKNAIIVAGGSGTRLGGDLPKQFQDLNGRPVLWWSLKAFHDEDPTTKITLVLNPEYIPLWMEMYMSLPMEDRFVHEVAEGGDSRTQSVKNGIILIPPTDNELIAVHDAARPLVTVDMIREGWEEAGKHGVAIPAVPVTDSIRRLTKDGSEAVDRKDYVSVQTPQVFKASVLVDAYEKNPDAVFSDDASAVEAAGYKPVIFTGSPRNIKVTNPGDIQVASLLLNSHP